MFVFVAKSRCIVIACIAVILTGCSSDDTSDKQASCAAAVRLHQETTLGMRKFGEAFTLPEGDPRLVEILMDPEVQEAIAVMQQDFCPAFRDCGEMPGYEDMTESLVVMCDMLDTMKDNE